mmetsp:Transcript_6339/g.4780  ORF Transcript_6339/g.4780 Transcript_6339/m.4780 type:complete len:82 (-) Transcript_6339:216-461(-)
MFNYKKLSYAANYIMINKTKFIATNPDKTITFKNIHFPGNGSIVASIRSTVNVSPIIIGKPERAIFDLLLEDNFLGASPAL